MTDKRFTIIYGIDENPFEWDIMDNEKDALICQCNGKPICDLLNELHEEKEGMQGEIDHCHRIIETLVAQKGVTDYMDLLNLCDKDILIENGWEIREEEE